MSLIPINVVTLPIEQNFNKMRKSSTIKFLCIAVAFVFSGFAANAQLTHLEQSVFLNFNLPGSEFNDDLQNGLLLSGQDIPLTRYNVGKGAGFGFGFGYRISYRFDVGFGEVSPYIHADLMWNRSNSDIRDKFLDIDGKAPHYINLPLYVGINYRYQLTDIFTPFAEFGLGPDFLFITKEKGTVTWTDDAGAKQGYEFNFKYKTTTSLAWQVGLGCYFGQHVSASLHYSGYGKHPIKLKKGETEQNSLMIPTFATDAKTQNRSLGLFSLRIGFHF